MGRPPSKKNDKPAHPAGCYHRYTWMGMGWKPRNLRKKG